MANEDQNPKQNPENPNEDASKSPQNSRPSVSSNDPPRARVSSQQEVTTDVVQEKSPNKAAAIGSAPSSKGKKRAASCGSTSATTIQPKKPELFSPQKSPACHICGKEFATRPAVFGHMKCHRNRPWRGASPPPMWTGDFNRYAVEEEVSTALVKAANDAQLRMENQMGATPNAAASASASASRSPAREILNIDLNEDHVEDASSSESASKKDFMVKFDLNKPPPEDDNFGGGVF